MKRYIRLALISVILVFGAVSCAKDVGEDNVPKIANTIQIAAEFVTTQGLTLLHDKKPEEIPGALADLGTITVIAQKYADGSVSVGDVAFTITEALNRLNARFAVIDSEYTGQILASVNILARIVEIYFVQASLPSEFGIYLGGFSQGIGDGLAWYNTTYPPEVPSE